MDIQWDTVMMDGEMKTILRVKIRSPKETKGLREAEVELWQDHQTPHLCPISSYKKYLELCSPGAPPPPTQPAFQRSCGNMACATWFNSTLSTWEADNPSLSGIRLHSLRLVTTPLLSSSVLTDPLGHWCHRSSAAPTSLRISSSDRGDGEAQHTRHTSVTRGQLPTT